MPPILLLAFLLVAQDKPADKCAVSGTVIDSATGAPLTKAEVFLESLDAPHGPFDTATADAKGHFSLAGLDPGRYRIRGVRNGYLDTYYGARRGDSTGIPVVLEAGQELKDLQLKLLPYAVIAGTIRDPDGEPVAGAKVSVRRLVYYNGHRDLDDNDEIVTDDLGQYRAASLVPGKYYVEVHPRRAFEPMIPPMDRSGKSSPPREVLLPALYPGVRDAAASKAVEVAPGARVTGIDIPLIRSRVYHVSGRITAPLGAMDVQIGPADPSLLDRIAWAYAVNGDFDIRDVPPGSYVFRAVSSTPAGSWNAELPVTVTGSDVTGVTLSLAPGSEVSGHVLIEGEKRIALDNSWVNFGSGRGASIHSDGNFGLNIAAGRYLVDIVGAALRRGLIIASIRAGETDILRDGLTLNAGEKAQVEIVLAPDGGQIDGAALDKDDQPVAGATVAAVPEAALRVHPNRFYEASTDQYGRYQLKNVAPGDYKLFAWDDVEPGAWFDPDFLRDIEKQGQSVKLGVKGHESAPLHTVVAK